MLAFSIFTAFVFICGAVIGATLLRDFLKRPRRVRPTIPLARVLHDTKWRQLDLPAVRRRQRIEVVRS